MFAETPDQARLTVVTFPGVTAMWKQQREKKNSSWTVYCAQYITDRKTKTWLMVPSGH